MAPWAALQLRVLASSYALGMKVFKGPASSDVASIMLFYKDQLDLQHSNERAQSILHTTWVAE